MLVVIEGPDGVGKDTVAKAVAEAIGGKMLNLPNDASESGKVIRSYLKREWWVENGGDASKIAIMAFQALATCNRLEMFPQMLEASLASATGPRIVLARAWQSGWVYGQLDGLDPAWLRRIAQQEIDLPHVNILLQAPAEVCMARRAARDGALPPERYEGKLETTQKICALYDQLWSREEEIAGGALFGWERIDATLPVEEVVTRTLECVRSYL